MAGTSLRDRVTPVALLPTVVVLGLLVLVWAASSGPVRILGSRPARPPAGRPPPPPSASATPSDSAGPLTFRDVTRDVKPSWDLSWVGELLAYAFLVGVALAVFLLARWLWLHRWHAPEKPMDASFGVLPERALLDALHDDEQAQLSAVERGVPRDGIVACWMRLEEIGSSAGVPPRPSETSAEFVARVLDRLHLDPRVVEALAELYREARFSEHEMGEQSRTAARSALLLLHDDLHSRGAVG